MYKAIPSFIKYGSLFTALILCAGTATSARTKPTAPKHTKKPKAVAKTIAAKPVVEDAPKGSLKHAYSIQGDNWTADVIINSLEYKATRYNIIGDKNEIPIADEKLLLVHFNVKNTTSDEMPFDAKTIRFTAFDNRKARHSDRVVVVDENTGEAFDGTIRAKESMDFVKVIHIPAKSVIHKIMMQPAPLGEVDFYIDTKDLIGKIEPDFQDPKDKTGTTPLEMVTAHVNQAYPVGDCDLTLTSKEYSDDAVFTESGIVYPSPGYRYYIITFNVKSFRSPSITFTVDNLNPVLKTIDDDTIDPVKGPLLATYGNDPFSGKLMNGDDDSFRIIFPVSKHAVLQSLTIQAGPLDRKFLYHLDESE